MEKKLLFQIVCGTALLVTGCQNTVNSVSNAEKNYQAPAVADKRFVTDSFLKRRLRLNGIKKAVSDSGFMTVEVTAVNMRTGFFSELWSGMTGENPYPVAYKFSWQDKNGMFVETPLSNWQQRIIHPGETVSFRSTAPTAECRDFVLQLKEVK